MKLDKSSKQRLYTQPSGHHRCLYHIVGSKRLQYPAVGSFIPDCRVQIVYTQSWVKVVTILFVVNGKPQGKYNFYVSSPILDHKTWPVFKFLVHKKICVRYEVITFGSLSYLLESSTSIISKTSLEYFHHYYHKQSSEVFIIT